MFPRIQYLEWMHGRPERVTWDLGSSDFRRAHDGVIPDRLDDLAAVRSEVPLETRIAAAYGPEIGPEQVLVTSGASLGNVLALLATRERAEAEHPAVLVEAPTYEPLVATPQGFDTRVTRFERPGTAGFPLRPDAVREALTPETALVIVTNRHNPTGVATDRETLAEVAEIVSAADATLLVDEVYAPFTVDPGEGTGYALGGETAAGLPDTVVTNSVTKFLGFGGLKIGWLVAHQNLVETARSVAPHLPAVAETSRRLAGRVFANLETLAEESRRRLRENHRLLSDFVCGRDDLVGDVPPGSSFAFLGIEGADGDRVSEVAAERDMLIVPGRFFGHPERFRISLGGEPPEMAGGLDRFEAVLEEFSASDE
ncbi:MAG: pyridoxal phosphate-dependent aminotransferase [Halodesulfurarchaeum sp.]